MSNFLNRLLGVGCSSAGILCPAGFSRILFLCGRDVTRLEARGPGSAQMFEE